MTQKFDYEKEKNKFTQEMLNDTLKYQKQYKFNIGSTSVHEVGHWFLNTWQKYAPQSKEIESDVNAIRKFVGNKGEEFRKEQHEKFSNYDKRHEIILNS